MNGSTYLDVLRAMELTHRERFRSAPTGHAIHPDDVPGIAREFVAAGGAPSEEVAATEIRAGRILCYGIPLVVRDTANRMELGE